MGVFVTQNTPLPAPKRDANPPVTPEIESDAADFNGLWGAIDDVRTHTSGWVNVLGYGADSTGHADSTAAFNAANAAGLNIYVPKGTYLLNKWTPKTGTRLIGAGWFATILQPYDVNQSVIFIDRDASTIYSYGIEIGHLRIKGFDTGTGHGVESTSTSSGAAGLSIHDVWAEHFNAAAIYLDGVWTSRLDRVWVDYQGPAGHAFDLGTVSTGTRLSECYAKSLTPGSGMAGFRVRYGQVTLHDCNGIDAGDIWGIFGSAVAAGDAIDATARVTIAGCNLEDFGRDGLIFRKDTRFSIDGCHFFAPVSVNTTGSITTGTPTLTVASATGLYVGRFITIAGVTGSKTITAIAGTTVTLDSNADATVANAAVATAVRAIYVANTGATTMNIYGPANMCESKGVAWKNGQPAHCVYAPPLMKFNAADFNNCWMESSGFGGGLPNLSAAQSNVSCLRLRGGLTIDDGTILGAFIRNHFSAAFTTWAGATLAAGASTSQNITFTGPARGHTALVGYDGGSDNALPAGVFMTAVVVAANTVRVVVTNTTAASVTIPAGTLRVDSWQHF